MQVRLRNNNLIVAKPYEMQGRTNVFLPLKKSDQGKISHGCLTRKLHRFVGNSGENWEVIFEAYVVVKALKILAKNVKICASTVRFLLQTGQR